MNFYNYTYWLVLYNVVNEVRDWVSFTYPNIQWWEMYTKYWDDEYDGPRSGMVVWFDETVHSEINVVFKLVHSKHVVVQLKPEVFVKLDQNGDFIGPQPHIYIKRHDPSNPVQSTSI